MKPYNRIKIITGHTNWKIDYHMHDKNHHKLKNWWEDMSSNTVGRNTVKQKYKKNIYEDINNS